MSAMRQERQLLVLWLLTQVSDARRPICSEKAMFRFSLTDSDTRPILWKDLLTAEFLVPTLEIFVGSLVMIFKRGEHTLAARNEAKSIDLNGHTDAGTLASSAPAGRKRAAH